MDSILEQMMRNYNPQSITEKKNSIKEVVQEIVLCGLSRAGFFHKCAFYGGTALRIFYGLDRFSEDLDFSTIYKNSLDLGLVNKNFISGFEKYGFNVETKTKNVGAVCSITFKFEGLLKELELSALSSQKLLIKWDVDQNPPMGANTANTIINKHFMFNINHHDLPSLFAGKLNACFYRSYLKGRDWYDFLWYVSKKQYPNFDLLKNAIKQTQNEYVDINKSNFKEFLMKRIDKVDFDNVKKDVERFLEDKSELEALNQRYIKDTINSAY